jgi:hypothetical protein
MDFHRVFPLPLACIPLIESYVTKQSHFNCTGYTFTAKGELESIWKEVAVAYFIVLSKYYWGSEKNHKDII